MAMCGISGIFSRATINPLVLKQMNDRLYHRGPDGEGYCFSKGVASFGDLPGLIDFRPESDVNFGFAHRRLSIVDLSTAGHQPMTLHERYVITYNGEVYNHPELRVELEALGYSFCSHTDTEVILAAYDAWGAECLKRFNGMWAFVIIDTAKSRVFISRDRFGIKPFYFYRTESAYMFASEIKAILAHPDINTEPDLEYCRNYLENGATELGPATGFVGVNRFPISSYIECTLDDLLNKEITPIIYWRVLANTSFEQYDESTAVKLASDYKELLQDAVRLRLRADVKVGSALSGGLDSSSIVYLINNVLKQMGREEQQETFSCVYLSPGTESCDESHYINRLAEVLSVKSNQIEPRARDIPKEHERMIYAMDTLPDSTCMSGWHTFMRVAQSDVTVTLDGQGADEQMGGYLGYFLYWFAQAPLTVLLREFFPAFTVPGAGRMALRGLALNLLSQLIGKSGVRWALGRLGRSEDPFIPMNEILLRDTLTNLTTLIHYSDRVSMAHSIESRMPFMDYRLVEFLANTPAVYKLHNGWTKYIARKAFDGLLPSEIAWRKDKMGWAIPEHHWLTGELNHWLTESVESSDFICSLNCGGKDEIKIESETNIARSVRRLNLVVWYRVFFNSSFGVCLK